MKPSELLEEWRRLSVEESRAIDTESWERVLEFQSRKAGLQRRYDAEAVAGTVSGGDEGAIDPVAVAGLLAQETMNLQRVQRRRDAAEPQRAELERSRRDLRRLRSTFGIVQQSSWQQYS